MFTEKDIAQFKSKGISIEQINWQICLFEKGAVPINLIAPATIGNAILQVDNKVRYIELANNSKKLKYIKFVPASGAASRMFKDLFEFREKLVARQSITEMPKPMVEFFNNLPKFAFYTSLNHKCSEWGGVEALIKSKDYVKILDALLDTTGLAYGELPKGILLFHKAEKNRACTPFEEHLTEGALYAKSEGDKVVIHFTVSPEHQEKFEKLKNSVLPYYEKKYGVKYDISFSVQKPSTDTIAVTAENTPFYDSDGSVLFRPGGHGALLENLNELDADIIFIKNIDNVVPETKVSVTSDYKKVLAGLLIETREKVFETIGQLKINSNDKLIQAEAMKLISNVFSVKLNLNQDSLSAEKLNEILLDRLERPIRVCGVVKNQGEPGGGPFIVKDKNGIDSIQIVEDSQIDTSNSQQQKVLAAATHFNPCDIACSVTNSEGKKYDLRKFVDEDTCFISKKSKSGKELKALELPGLWNGAMAGWNTIFVEVPVETFNPVKTINDLLRTAHQI